MYKVIRLMACGSVFLAISYSVRAAESATNTIPSAPKKSILLFEDKVVARGKGFEIKRSQVEEAFTAYRASAAAQGQAIPEPRRAEVETQMLDRMVNVQLLLSMATEMDKKRAKEAADRNFEEYRKKAASEEAFKRQLIVLGITVEKFRERTLEEALVKEVIDREVKSTIIVSDADAKKFYQDNTSQYDIPEKVRISRILLLTQDPATRQDMTDAQKQEKKKLAEKIQAQAKAGADFAGLAKDYSEEPRARDTGGEVPPFGRGYMIPELEAAAFSMRPNQISDVIQTPYAFHIMKMIEKMPARKISFAEASPEIRDILASQEVQKRLPDYLKKIRSAAGVQFLPN